MAEGSRAIKTIFHRKDTSDSIHGPGQPKGGMFVNAVEMKEKMRAQLAKPPYDVRNFYKTRGCFQYIARHPFFDRVSLSVIAFNAFWIAVDTDYNDSSVLSEADWPFQAADHFFCTFFFCEWAIRFFAFERKRNGFKDAWFVFDGIMVAMMVIETWIMTIILWLAGVDASSMGSTGVLKLIRMTRLTRMARMARLFRAMPELLVLLKGMWAATRSVFFTLLLLFIIIYIFGIAFTQIAGGSKAGEMYFQSVPMSMHTLLLRGTLMDDMLPVISQLDSSSDYHLLPGFFYIFILISSLTVMNMLIGVLCEVVAAVSATEKEEASVAFVKWQIRDIMRKSGLDADGDGMLSKAEFVQILDNPVATKTLSNAGVDVFGLVDCADFIFDGEHVSEDGLSFADFMEVVLQLRGTNTATVKDIVDLRKFVSVETKRLYDTITSVEKRVKKIGEVPSQKPRLALPSSKQIETEVQTELPEKLIEYPSASNAVPAEPPVQSRQSENKYKAPAHEELALPSINVSDGPVRDELLAANFDQVCNELDHLRQYVDTELHSIASDIKKKMEEWPTMLRPKGRVSGDAMITIHDGDMSSRNCTQETDNFHRPCIEETLSLREFEAERNSSCAAAGRSPMMCPGAELRCRDPCRDPGDRRGLTCGVTL